MMLILLCVRFKKSTSIGPIFILCQKTTMAKKRIIDINISSMQHAANLDLHLTPRMQKMSGSFPCNRRTSLQWKVSSFL